MFNQLSPARVVASVGGAALRAARAATAPAGDDFARGQLYSAASTCRHLAVELESYPDSLHRFAEDVAQVVQRQGDLEATSSVATGLGELTRAHDATSVGKAVSDLILAIRAAGDPSADSTCAELRARMRALAEEEVALLAAVIEPGERRKKEVSA